MKHDVIVIGAGYAGLTAARSLHSAGMRVIVLESQNRVGGRALTERTEEHPIDLGGQWTGPGQLRIRALADHYGLTTYPSHTTGSEQILESTSHGGNGIIHRLNMLPHLMTLLPAVVRLHHLVKKTDPTQPWHSKITDRWDTTTVEEWLETAVTSRRARRWADATLREAVSTDLGNISMLALANEIASAGGLRSTMGFEGGAQQDLFVDGADRLPTLMAAELDVRLDSQAQAVSRSGGSYRVTTSTGVHHMADRIVVATPPPLTREIDFEPALPPAQLEALNNLRMGSVLKMFAIYDRPFWREDGKSGMALLPDGPATTVADVSPPGGPGHICILACGRDADRLSAMDPDIRRRTVLDALERLFGQKARTPRTWLEKNWTEDPWARGGYSALPTPGTLASIASAHTQHTDGIYWAGTETARQWQGFFEGAIESGERAATEVIDDHVATATPALREEPLA